MAMCQTWPCLSSTYACYAQSGTGLLSTKEACQHEITSYLLSEELTNAGVRSFAQHFFLDPGHNICALHTLAPDAPEQLMPG